MKRCLYTECLDNWGPQCRCINPSKECSRAIIQGQYDAGEDVTVNINLPAPFKSFNREVKFSHD